MEVKCMWFKGQTGFGIKGWIIRFFESQFGSPVDMNMIRVFVSPDRVERKNNIGFKVADVFHDTSGHFVDRMGNLCIRMVIIR